MSCCPFLKPRKDKDAKLANGTVPKAPEAQLATVVKEPPAPAAPPPIAEALKPAPVETAVKAAPVEKAAPESIPAPVEAASTALNDVEIGKASANKCPYAHGSVGAGPFPGYVHGKHPAICPNGCVPDPQLDKYGRKDETPIQTLVREALEYQELYHREIGNSDDVKQKRIAEILAEIEATGIYTQTFDELQHGARVAWRNAPKCPNRKFWEDINLIDKRDVTTNQDMFRAGLEVLEVATLSCVTTANIAVFRPQTPGTEDGPRFWNTQLLRFMGYTRDDGTVLGDPAEKAFTTMLQTDLKHQLPEWEKRTAHDFQPMVCQIDPTKPPEIYKIPPHYGVKVPITHPEYPQFADLNISWYAVPAVSCLELSVGGLTYTACPFNGWYSVTEIVRNLTDQYRYDLVPVIAEKLGWSTRSDSTMWRDKVIAEVTLAIMYSFKEAGLGMVDHHTLMKNFFSWYHKEKANRGYVPGNWKWIIPPVTSSHSRCYMELNKMTEYTIKPGYWYAPGWRHYAQRLKKDREAANPAKVNGMEKRNSNPSASKRLFDVKADVEQMNVVLIYASTTGNTAKYAEAVGRVLSGPTNFTILNMEDFEVDSWTEKIGKAGILLILSSTYGPGAPPSSAKRYLAWVQNTAESTPVLKGKPFSVVGFGSSSYPRFCAAADMFQTVMLAAGATSLVPLTKVDMLGYSDFVVWDWLRSAVAKMEDKSYELLDGKASEAILARIPVNTEGQIKTFVPVFTLIDLGTAKGLVAARDSRRHAAPVVDVKKLATAENGALTVQFILEVGKSQYLAGDEIAIFAENTDEEVERVAQGLGIKDLDAMFLMQRTVTDGDGAGDDSGLGALPFPLPNTYRTILTRYLALNDPVSFEGVNALSQYASGDTHLAALAGDYQVYQDWQLTKGVRWSELFQEFPSLTGGTLPVEVMMQLVSRIKPRHYSISSSSSAVPGQVHLTVSQLKYTMPDGTPRNGFCSSFLCTRKTGDLVAFHMIPTPGFRMPLDPAAPVVMVAAGTGIAPFKGFWEERAVRLKEIQESNDSGAQLGDGVLFFGCRSSATDQLYSQQLKEMVGDGVLSQVLVAYSREPKVRKQYVQDKIQAHGADLATLLKHPKCHVYVCGSSNMAQDVALAFGKVLGQGAFSQMVNEGRYHEDVFGMNVPNVKAATQAATASSGVKLLAKQPLAQVVAALDKGDIGVDAVDEDSSSLLHIAARTGNLPLVALLVTRGAAVNMVNVYGLTPLMEAHMGNHKDCIMMIEMKGGVKVSALHKQFYPLHAAVMEGDLDNLKQTLAEEGDPNSLDYHTNTPLHIACVLGNEEAVKLLLEAKATLDVQNKRGMMPLQLALMYQRNGVADMLKAAGASLVVGRVTTAQAGAKGQEIWSAQTGAALMDAVGLTEAEVACLQASWSFMSGESYPAQVKEKLEAFGVDLFMYLFEQYPPLLALFPFKDENGKPILKELKVHGLKVVSTVGIVVEKIVNFDSFTRFTKDLIERHIQYGVVLGHYEVVLGALMKTMKQVLKEKWDPQVVSGWTKVMKLVTTFAEQIYEQKRVEVAATAKSNAE